MFWKDTRVEPTVELNCSLIKMWLEESNDESNGEIEDEFVEHLTRRMETYISIQLNRGKTISIHEAFYECY